MTWNEICKEALANFPNIDPCDLVAGLKHRFHIEHISKYFRSSDYSFSGGSLNIDPNNSILIEFASLQAEYPDFYPAKQYRLLLLVGLHRAESITTDLSLELNTVRRKDNIDRIVMWSCGGFDAPTLHSLKGNAIDVISIVEKDLAAVASIAHYMPIDGKDHNYALTLNLAADLLLKRLKKMFHLVLSEVAAPIYDRLYAKQKVATDEMMRFEEKLVKDTIQRFLPNASDRRVAVDVGCGTGRHTFPLAKTFDRVYAFDFSPLMIKAAATKKSGADIRNVLFSVADLEYETIRDEGHFQNEQGGQVDLIVASFGLASFIEDTAGMMRRFHGWLRENGTVLLSFYNKQTILTEITPNWRDTSLSAHLDTETDTLRVELSPKTVFHIYCKAYNNEIQQSIADSFDIQQITTFPTLMALMPNSLLQSGKALGIFRFVDETLAEHKEYKFGHYVSVVARKKSTKSNDALLRVQSLLTNVEARFELISHPPVISTEDVRRYLDMSDGFPVKTLLFRRQEDRKLVVVVVPAKMRVDTASLAKQMGVRRLFFGSDRDVLAIGFPLGGIAPFGFLPGVVEKWFIERRLLTTDDDWIYTGSGDNSKTLKVRRSDLLRLLKDYEPIDA
jgi:prolyl-tRNA editing enzyme YbaK/EbsC (Cys-tRNA(Pro) deacylase)/ubiquinone/menaquinone biosynthesis C-methylase UbiE